MPHKPTRDTLERLDAEGHRLVAEDHERLLDMRADDADRCAYCGALVGAANLEKHWRACARNREGA